MTENPIDQSKGQSPPRLVKVLWILVAITAVLSLLYGILYFLGVPVRLPVVSEINSLDLSPNGELAAAGARDGQVRIWNVPPAIRTGVDREFDVGEEEPWPVRTLSGPGGSVLAVGFAPDGATLIAATGDGLVRAWNVADDAVIQEFDLGAGPQADVALSDNREVLAVLGEDGAIRVWDVAAEQEVQSFGPGEGPRLAVALNADGTLVAAGEGTGVQVWDVQSGDLVQTLAAYCEDGTGATQEACEEADEDWLGHEQEVTVLAFSPDGQILATGSADSTVVFWDLETGEAPWSSVGHWDDVTAMKFSEDGAFLLTGGKDYKVRNLRVTGGKQTAVFEGHLSTLNALAYGPQEDTIVTVGDDGTLRVWETANQYNVHREWSRLGLQPAWGRLFAIWMLVSGVLGLVALFGLRRGALWSHLLVLAMYLVGPLIVLGLPLLESIDLLWLIAALLGVALLRSGLRHWGQTTWLSLILFLLGIVLILGLPVYGLMMNPLSTGIVLKLTWLLLILAVWYGLILLVAMREEAAIYYEAPRDVSLSEQIMISQRTLRTRFGIYSLAVWIALLVILYSILRQFNLDIAFMGSWLKFIMAGSAITFVVSAASIVLAIVFALMGALGRLSKNPIANAGSGFYISLIRGTPLLVQIYIWYLGLPRLGIVLPPITAGILALSVNYGAYMTEIFRAGIQAVSVGQREAAQALGMTGGQTFRRIILPQAFRIVIPPIGNEFIAMMKDSSLVSIMAVQELTWRANKVGRQYFRGMETFLIAAAFYWVLTVIFQLLQGRLEDYMARGERR
jgi:polar amino acid transport system permease protein